MSLPRELKHMISLERILCPTRLPFEPDETLGHAVNLARAYKAKLLLCHCAAPPALAQLFGASPSPRQAERQLAESLVGYLGPAKAARLRWELVVAHGGRDVGESIVKTARDQRVDLIVIRSRRSRVAALLGSTAEQVSRTASCPVLVIHPGEGTDGYDKARFRSVLVSHDFSGISELALSYAVSIALKFRADLHVMHVLPLPEEDEPEISLAHVEPDSIFQRVARRLQDAVPEEVYERCRVVEVVRWGKPYREVLAYAREQDVKLISMGALGSDFGLEALFGSNVDRVLRQATCPVLVARPLQPAVRESLIAAPQRAGNGNIFSGRTSLKGVEHARSDWT
jgi:nucleotide-binding universal stress UspA family protein